MWIKPLHLTLHDKSVLDREQLTANHINAAQKLLLDKYPEQFGLQDTHQLSVGNWASTPIDFVQVIFFKPNHWVCATNKFCSSENEVDLYDSLNSTLYQDSHTVRQICTILRAAEPKITINRITSSTQLGVKDCGLFAIAVACDLCQGVDPYKVLYDQDEMRSHLVKCFEEGDITSFPSNPSSQAIRISDCVEIEIFCYCRQPEELPMAACDVCQEWYHQQCAEIPDSTLELLQRDKTVNWYCPSCRFRVSTFFA